MTGHRFGKGYNPDTHDKSKDPPIQALLGARVGVAPTAASLEQYITAIYDQGPYGSCVGWAIAQAIMLRCGVVGTPIALPSPAGIYTVARAIERRQQGLDPVSNPLQDQGSMPGLAISGIGGLAGDEAWGVANDTDWPVGGYAAALAAGLDFIDAEPDLEELEIASAFILTGYYRINSTGAGREADIKHAIASGYPVVVGTQVDQAFEDYLGGRDSAGKPLAVTAPTGQILGGHMLHLVGYTADGLYRGRNQWSTTWGDQGMFWATPEFVTNAAMGDIYVLTCNASGHAGGICKKAA